MIVPIPENKDLIFEDVRNKIDEGLINDLKILWDHDDGIQDENFVIERSKQILFTARTNDNKLVGVSSLDFGPEPGLGFNFYYYRTYVDADYRQMRAAEYLYLNSINKLTEEYIEGINRTAKGVIVVSTSPLLQKKATSAAVLPPYGFNFVGFNTKNETMHVYYFDGAKISV